MNHVVQQSYLILNDRPVACRLFYPAPLYANRQVQHTGEILPAPFESFEQYNAKIILPKTLFIPLGMLEIIHQQRRYQFRAEDTLWRSDRSIYGMVIGSTPIEPNSDGLVSFQATT